jgi:NitT/TauT family transport system substrate-binding protein
MSVGNRRQFLSAACAVGAASLLGLSRSARAEPPPEVRKIRLMHAPSICLAPQLLAEELLPLEGFSEVEYVDLRVNRPSRDIASGRADMSMVATPEVIPVLDTGAPVVVLGGIHAGCYELFGGPRVQRLSDIKGARIAISALGSPEHVYVSSIAGYVGIDPRRDLQWVVGQSTADAMRLFVEGKADAFLAFPPQPHALRSSRTSHLLVDTARDRPWSQYFCCVVAANKDFARKNPIATKRVLRAMLKGADICAEDPERAAQYLVERRYEPRYEVGLNVLKSLPYARWREADPEDTMRFHALRLHQVGMIRNTPQKIIAQGADWRFWNELKRELKA